MANEPIVLSEVRPEPPAPPTRDGARVSGDLRRHERIDSGPRDSHTRREIGNRDGWLCGLCLWPVDPSIVWSRVDPDPRYAVRDHIQPVAVGGSDVAVNVQIAHRSCNAYKHSRSVSVENARRNLIDRTQLWSLKVEIGGRAHREVMRENRTSMHAMRVIERHVLKAAWERERTKA